MSEITGKNEVVLTPKSAEALAPLAQRLLTPTTLRYLPEHWQPADNEAQALEWLNNQASDLLHIGVEEHSAGIMLVHKQENEWRIGFILLPEFWGRGIASKAISALQQLTRQEQSKITLFAGAASDNLASLQVLQKSGFNIESHGDEITATWHSSK